MVMRHAILSIFHFFSETFQHGGEGRLNEKFANALQHVDGDDVR